MIRPEAASRPPRDADGAAPATYSPIPTHPGTPLTDEPLTDEPWGSTSAGRDGRLITAVRIVLPLLVVIIMVAGFAMPLRPTPVRSELHDYLPSDSSVGRLVQYPSDGQWQGTQYRVDAGAGFDSLPAEAAKALGYAGNAAAPEPHGQWLMVDLQAPGGELRTVALQLQQRRLTLQANLTATTWVTFHPGLPVLDVDLLAGRTTTWSGTVTSLYRDEGQLSSTVSAVLSLSPTDGRPGCVTTTADLTFSNDAHGTRTWTWCDGQRGFAGLSTGDQGFVAGTGGEVPPVDLDAGPPTPRLTGTVRTLAAFRMAGGVLYATDLPNARQAVRAGRSVVLASRTTVWALRPDRVTATEVDREIAWRGRPGGLITSLIATGDQAVVATTDKQIVAYAANGWVRWRASLDDTASRLIAVGDTILAVEGHDRLRALDARTGVTRWTWRGGRIIDVSAGGTLVVVAQDGSLTALGRADGRRRWTARVPNLTAVAVLAGTVVTQQGGALVGRSTADGRPAWGRATRGQATGLWAAGALAVVGESRNTYAVRADGSVAWRADGAAQTVAGTGRIVALAYPDRVEAWGPDGRLARWAVPDGYTVPPPGLLVVSDTAVFARHLAPDGSSHWRAYQ